MDQPVFSLPPQLPELLLQAAAAKRIRGGRQAALMASLDNLAAGLAPGGASLFSALSRPSGPAGPTPPSFREIGDAFCRQRSRDRESARLSGRFYTPAAIIDHILLQVWDRLFPDGEPGKKDWRTLCDPALGCGFFFLRLLERLLERNPSGRPLLRRWAAASLYGVDIDAEALFLAKAGLWLALSDEDGEFLPPAGHFRLGDSLLGAPFGASGTASALTTDGTPSLDWPSAFPEINSLGGFDVLLGNPPYEVLTGFGRRPERAVLARALRKSGHYREALRGQLDLYRCFVERSLALLQPGGVLSLIVPLSLARADAALPLRRRLLEEEACCDWLIFREGDRAFPGVSQSVCIFRARRSGGPARQVRVIHDGASGEWNLADAPAWGGEGLVIPLPGDRERELAGWLRAHCGAALGDVADMRVGEVDQTLYRDCLRDADSGCLLARGGHLKPFRLDATPRPGKARFLDLRLFLSRKGQAAADCARRAALPRVAQLGIRNMQSRPRLVAALAPPGIYLGNSLNFYIPKADLPPECLAGLLNSRLLDRLFRQISGNNNINLHEMRRLPFPDRPDPEKARAVADAYRRCAAAAEPALTAVETALIAAREELDKAVEDFYDLPEELRKTLDGAG